MMKYNFAILMNASVLKLLVVAVATPLVATLNSTNMPVIVDGLNSDSHGLVKVLYNLLGIPV